MINIKTKGIDISILENVHILNNNSAPLAANTSGNVAKLERRTKAEKPPPKPINTKNLWPSKLPNKISISNGRILTRYYKKYWTGNETLAETSGRIPRTLTPSEKAGNDVMITIKTTRDYHRTRIQLLLDTWISVVNASNLFLVTDEYDQEYERKAKEIG